MNQRQMMVVSLMMSLCMALAAIAALSLLSPAHAMPYGGAQARPSGEPPVMIIRFNQQSVYYDKSLYNIVRRAVKLKPNVGFNVISYVPTSQDPLLYQRLISNASNHMREVTNTLMKMGIRGNRLSMATHAQHGLKHDEIHIYIQ
ncbi:MAG: hypothetical protein MRY32_07735 [Rickettsiales bacterium]|nr:hypothetical protein [Rickettsiales bacterium]